MVHHANGHRLDAGRRVDDHGRRLDRLERRQALAQEIGGARGVDEVNPRVAVHEMEHAGVERMLHAPLERIEVARSRAALQAARRADRSRGGEQRFGQAGLAGGGRADQRKRPDRFDAGAGALKWAWHANLLCNEFRRGRIGESSFASEMTDV